MCLRLFVLSVAIVLGVSHALGDFAFPDEDNFAKTVKTKTTKIVRPFNPQRLSYSPTANGCGTPKVFNAAISCTNNKCQVKCMNKYAFPSGDTQLMVNCEDGEWVFDRAEWTEIPPCKPICETPCQNQGICIEPGRCTCPDNFYGTFCEKKKQLCLQPPKLPRNSQISIQAATCTVTCRKGHTFPDQTSVTNMQCIDGQWRPSRPEWTLVPDCLPTCQPQCQNGGTCLAVNVCQCPRDRRGSLCQYDMNVCNPKERLNFNGMFNCTGDQSEMRCQLDCPTGIKFAAQPAVAYVCRYESGIFLPADRPQCVFPPGVRVMPGSEYSHGYYVNGSSSSSASGSQHSTKQKKIRKIFYESSAKGRAGDEYEDEDDDDEFEKVITKTKIEIKRRRKTGNKKGRGGSAGGYYEIEEEQEDDISGTYDAATLNGMYALYVVMGGSQVVNTRTAKGATCQTWNGNKVKTFDGLVYSAQLQCSHTLVQDIVDGSFSVIFRASAIDILVDNAVFSFTAVENGVQARMGDRELRFPIQRTELRARLIGRRRLLVQLDSSGLKLEWDMKQTITVETTAAMWNRTGGLCGTLDQDVSTDLRAKDGTLLKTVGTFVDAWAAPALDSGLQGCEMHKSAALVDGECKADVQLEAQKVCAQLIAGDRFVDCLKMINRRAFIRNCVSDYCGCANTVNKSECVCSSVAVLAADCQFQGIVFQNGWRDQKVCPMQCPVGEVYQSCGPSFEPHCGFSLNEASVECTEGCFCPGGQLRFEGKCVELDACPCQLRNKTFPAHAHIRRDCNTCECSLGKWQCSAETCGARCSAIGDPHYQTFDQRRFDFMGKCAYTLMQTANVSIEAENVACSGQISADIDVRYAAATDGKGSAVDQPSCTKSVTIALLNGDRVERVKLLQGRAVFVNGAPLPTIPSRLFGGRLKIREASSTVLSVRLADGLKVWWDGVTNVYIDAPAAYRNQTAGLCGTFNSNAQDDFLTPEGDTETAVEAFANKWRTRESCGQVDSDAALPDACQLNVENRARARTACAVLRSEAFASCDWYVGVEQFHADCMYDMCSCRTANVRNCLCPVLQAYASQCAQAGVPLQWRHRVAECAVQCPAGQVFEECGDSCHRTCADLHAEDDDDDIIVDVNNGVHTNDVGPSPTSSCRSACVEGCRCPRGQLLNDNGECVPTIQCACHFDGRPYSAGYKEVRAGRRHLELCTCTNARWSCTKASESDAAQYPAAADKRKECAADPTREFVECMPELVRTCKNMHQYAIDVRSVASVAAPAGECRSGCVCRADRVWDSFKQLCVTPTQCGCHHGGKSFETGQQIRSDCNTCECSSLGEWRCTDEPCPATCVAWGDSHFESFDGRDFDFQGVCSYLLSKGVLPETDDAFAISIQNVQCGTLGVTCSKSVTIALLGNTRETITLDSAKDTSTQPPQSTPNMLVYNVGLFTVVELRSLDVQVKWDRGTRVYIRLGVRWRRHVQGLCGNYNGDAEDDLKTPAAGVEANPTLFGDSWKLEEFCERPQEQIDTCAAHPERKLWAQRQCGILKSPVFERCHAEVSVDRFMRRCVYDSCGCDQGGDCHCLCTAIAAYAHECAAKGVPIRWRTPQMCPMQCDVSCSEYTPCLSSACPTPTCDDSTSLGFDAVQQCESGGCIEGCQVKPCGPGQIYRNSTFAECVPKSTCRPVCLQQTDVTFYEGDVLSSDACHTCHCTRGKSICSGLPCSTRSTMTTTTPRPTTVKTQPYVERPTTEATPVDYQDGAVKCLTGWSAWINQDSSKSTHKTGSDIEPIPDHILLSNLNESACCLPADITHIECRTADEKLSAKQVGELVECSIDRGLVARGARVHDYEIRVYCKCANRTLPTTPDVNVNTKVCDPSAPNREYPGDCHKFLQCVPQAGEWRYVEKTCGPTTMYNPTNMICDWPLAVQEVKPDCRKPILAATTTTTTQRTPTSDDQTRCPPGQRYYETPVDCKDTCHYYGTILQRNALCPTPLASFQLGCVMTADRTDDCGRGRVWRDDGVCTEREHCTCASRNGTMLKPGFVYKESECEWCQCVHNEYVCDRSRCVRPVEQLLEVPVKPAIMTTTPTPFTAAPTQQQVTTEVLLVIENTQTPPTKCVRSRMIPIIDGDAPLADSVFSASSYQLPNAAKYARLVTDNYLPSYYYWQPAKDELSQYLQVKLPSAQPIYGIQLRGIQRIDSYVTSAKLLYSYDDLVYHVVKESGVPLIIRGPNDAFTTVESIFDVPIEARYVRIYPLTWNKAIAMQVELLGCQRDEATTKRIPTTVTTTVTIRPIETTTRLPTTAATNPELLCDEPMGIETGQLNANQLQFSSFKAKTPLKAAQALRLSSPIGWQPKLSTKNEYVQIDFTQPRLLNGLITRGGAFGWVTAYAVTYSLDGIVWSRCEDLQQSPKTFLANFDAVSARTNHFDRAINMRYMRLQPISWQSTIELKLEPIGCFKSYPLTTSTSTSTEQPELVYPDIALSKCGVCEGVPEPPQIIENLCECDAGLMWNGKTCVDPVFCPCIVGHVPYDVGAKYQLDDCSKCTCLLGGHAQCSKHQCPPCPTGLRSMPGATACSCKCEPCSEAELLCPTSGMCIPEASWCDGIEDCPDDEVRCTHGSHNTTTIKEVVKESLTTTCAIVRCPPGYKKQIISTNEATQTRGRQESVANDRQRLNRTYVAEQSDQCVQFKCIPKAIVPAAYTESPTQTVFCPVPKCPANYTVQMHAVATDVVLNSCANYTCQLNTEKENVCSVIGKSFVTFDAAEFKFSVCQHILAKSVDDQWTVILNASCAQATFAKCHKNVIIADRRTNTTIQITAQLRVFIDGYEFGVAQLQSTRGVKLRDYRISLVGNTLVVRSGNGFWVTLNRFGDVKVGAAAALRNTVLGLCGNNNGVKSDDKHAPNGDQLVDTEAFGRAWAVDGTHETCVDQTQTCTADARAQALRLCHTVQNRAFDACATVMNFQRFVDRCMEFACECIEANGGAAESNEQCKCAVLNKYAADCLAASSVVRLAPWRSAHGCQQTQCPVGQVYHECFRQRCEATCETLRSTTSATEQQQQCNELMSNSCASGCFCPEGQVRSGETCVDPNECADCVCTGSGSSVFTYDARSVQLPADCGKTVLLTSPTKIMLGLFEVYATMERCGLTMCIGVFTILSGEHSVLIRRPGQATIIDNEIVFDAEYERDWIRYHRPSNASVRVRLPQQHVSMLVQLIDMTFTLTVPSIGYRGQLHGLCGDCNDDASNDEITAKLMTLDASALRTRNSLFTSPTLPKILHQANETCLSAAVVTPAPNQNIVCPEINPRDDPCVAGLLDLRTFGQCHLIVDPQRWLTACESATKCKTLPQRASESCAHIRGYAAACTQHNVCVDLTTIRSNCSAPVGTCPQGMQFEACGCPLTCADLDKSRQLSGSSLAPFCPVPRTAACVCPPGFVIHLNRCQPLAVCTQCDAAGHSVGDRWSTDSCTECTCEANGKTLCTRQKCLAATTTACPSGTVQRNTTAAGECCPSFVCDAVAANCSYFNATAPIRCAEHQRIKTITDALSGCVSHVCECVPSFECPPLQPVHLQTGETLTTDATGCCPLHKVRCNRDRCPLANATKCESPFEVRSLSSANDTANKTCCPIYECRPLPNKCIVAVDGGKQMRSLQETWSTSDPCVQQRCALSTFSSTNDSVPSVYPAVVNDVQKCASLVCPVAHEITYEANKCCPFCKQTSCEFEGRAIEPTQSIRSADNCTRYECSSATRGAGSSASFSIQVTREACPDVSACAMHLRYVKGCCTLCKSEALQEASTHCKPKPLPAVDTIKAVEKRTKLYGMCRNVKPIEGFTECSGACRSGTRYNKATFQQAKVCDCCAVSETTPLVVPLECDTGFVLDLEISVPKTCSCQPCDQ